MKQLLLLLLVLPVLSLAASPFDGTWIAELSSAKLPEKPDVIVLNKGIYECKTCMPALYIKANGTDQSVVGNPGYDSVAVRMVNDHRLDTTYKLGGKIVSQSNIAVAADGKTATVMSESRYGAKPVTATVKLTRVAAGAAGAHAYSGSWRMTAYEEVSKNGLSLTLRGTADGLQLNDNNGMSYDAKFDGKEYAIAGDPTHTMVTLKRIDERTIEETDKVAGKVEGVYRMTVAADGQSLTGNCNDKRRGTTSQMTLRKQK
jgi:hypothetical protein